MKLTVFELRKIWRTPFFLLCTCLLLFVNILLLWVNTQINENATQMNSYKTIGDQLSTFDESEKLNWLKDQTDICLALDQIDILISNAATSGSDPRIGHETLFDTYGEIYSRKAYPYFTESLGAEYLFYASLLSECESIYNYDAFLKNLQQKADSLSSISIFNTAESSYEQANIRSVAAAYADIDAAVIQRTYYPQKGIYTALTYPYTDLLLLASMLLIASVCVRSERDSGLLSLVRATPRGRFSTALAKLAATSISLLLLLFGLYGGNLLYCHAVYGLGDLSRSIQSVPFLMRCTAQLSVGEYLIAFFLSKWIVACTIGFWVLFAGLICRRAWAGWLLAIALPAVQFVVSGAISPTSRWSLIKYVSLTGLMNTNEWLTAYRNLYFFGTPLSLINAALLSLSFYLFLFSSSFALVFSRAELSSSNSHSSFRWISQKVPPITNTTVFREEARKIYLQQGAAILLIAFAGLNIALGVHSQTVLSMEETYYQYYMQHLSGPFDIQSYQWLVKQDEILQPLYELETQHNAGLISDEQYALLGNTKYDLKLRQETQQRIINDNFQRLRDNNKAQLVYEDGYRALFDLDECIDKQYALFATLCCILCCAGVFSFERQGNFDRILRTVPLGRRKTVSVKLQHAAFCCTLSAILSCIPVLWQTLRDYGLYALSAPALSLPEFTHVSDLITLCDLLVCWFLFRILACLCVGAVTLLLSQKTGNTILTLLCSSMIFALPLLLSMSGMLHIKWASIYPLYHWIALLAAKSGPVLWCWPIAAALLLLSCTQALFQSYQEDI